jgi:hypothetical protein
VNWASVLFPDASLGTPLLTLAPYAGIGMLILGAAIADAKHRNSLADLP